jgi:hypothetical protein
MSFDLGVQIASGTTWLRNRMAWASVAVKAGN